MDLMKLLLTLNLECQVAVKEFCSAIQTLVNDIISFPNQRKLYPVIIDSLEEFSTYFYIMLLNRGNAACFTDSLATSMSHPHDTLDCCLNN
ncbi:unnamed protein product [Porites lobata]|uniref:Uncharacterized protein n=1 Tax=Porites lobata TaxID=104759 RepID=A0ABN8QVQ5_9CNID|nr:unnamed protein product [Porites lobata]